MKAFGALVSIGIASCAIPPTAPRRNSTALLDPVRFMAGDWEGTSPDGRFDEHWTEPSGDCMLGVGREIASGKTTFFEFMRIEARSDGVYLVPQPRGKPGHDFRLVSSTGRSALFENGGDDRVHRISYDREGDSLSVKVEGNTLEEFRLKAVRR